MRTTDIRTRRCIKTPSLQFLFYCDILALKSEGTVPPFKKSGGYTRTDRIPKNDADDDSDDLVNWLMAAIDLATI